MIRADMKAIAESGAKHICAQLKPLLLGEWNPSKVRCGVSSLRDYLHRLCSQCSLAGACAENEADLRTMLDALAELNIALSRRPLNRQIAMRAHRHLAAIGERIQTN